MAKVTENRMNSAVIAKFENATSISELKEYGNSEIFDIRKVSYKPTRGAANRSGYVFMPRTETTAVFYPNCENVLEAIQQYQMPESDVTENGGLISSVSFRQLLILVIVVFFLFMIAMVLVRIGDQGILSRVAEAMITGVVGLLAGIGGATYAQRGQSN